ncbi:hypothetical protein BZL30_8014 [Mycobacterium kansasii]|uniref:Uncharacterized protein n=1 Tax=Mycobacterium kansasii TaxID=1768 RepID=A0A1V3WM27_MYCKA|nr:hypothetical protein BZL30_9524 [Mycobacterium kansasii]OOK67818.1 hypothetical protein BZL30_8014 [Mycobacterium kansasii]
MQQMPAIDRAAHPSRSNPAPTTSKASPSASGSETDSSPSQCS